jgi:hypothetical protein
VAVQVEVADLPWAHHLMVLCHTVILPECQYLLDFAKAQQPKTAILLLRTSECTCATLGGETAFDQERTPIIYRVRPARVDYGTNELRRDPESSNGQRIKQLTSR